MTKKKRIILISSIVIFVGILFGLRYSSSFQRYVTSQEVSDKLYVIFGRNPFVDLYSHKKQKPISYEKWVESCEWENENLNCGGIVCNYDNYYKSTVLGYSHCQLMFGDISGGNDLFSEDVVE